MRLESALLDWQSETLLFIWLRQITRIRNILLAASLLALVSACPGQVLPKPELLMRSEEFAEVDRAGKFTVTNGLISYGQAVLTADHISGDVNTGDVQAEGLLARRAATKQPTLTRLIERMVQRGLVLREDDPADRRQILLCITPLGQETVGHLIARAWADQCGQRERFGEARWEQLMDLVRELLGDRG